MDAGFIEVTQRISTPVAEKLCEDFAEWLEEKGLRIGLDSLDPRSYQDLARDFIEESNV